MTMLKMSNFQGEYPRTQPQDLPPTAAQSATNCDFTQNTLMGIKARELKQGYAVDNPKSIFIYEGLEYSYYAWDRDVDAVRSPVVDDQFSRFYWSDGTNFYVSRADLGSGGEPAANNRYLVGVPKPELAMTLVSLGAGTSTYAESRAYTYTYVNQYGEEGPPAAPCLVDMKEDQAVNMTYTVLNDSSGYCPVRKIRIYRTSTGSQGTDYLFVAEIVVDANDPSFSDTVKNSALGEAISTRGYYPPPQTLKGITAMPNGSLAGFDGNTVWFSEAFLPYAWKPANTQVLQHNVVGMCAYDTGIYVTTLAYPVIISGYSPDGMSSQKIPAIQAGVSKGSIVNAGAFVAWASHDGIVTARGLNASLDMSFQFFTRDEWRNRYASKLNLMRMNVHDGHLVVWFSDGTPGFLIRLDENTPSFTKLTDPITCAFVHPEADALYLGYGQNVYNFKGGASRMPFTHWSKDFLLPRPESLGAIQFIGGGEITVIVYVDGAQVLSNTLTITDTGATVMRLPSGFKCRRWSFKVEGRADSFVQRYAVVTSPSELANG